MRILAVTLALSLPMTAAIAEEAASPPSVDQPDLGRSLDRCGAGNGLAQYRADGGLTVQPLGEMPPAAEIRAVYRTVGGCPAPVVLRKGIGANPEKQLPLAGSADVVPLDR